MQLFCLEEFQAHIWWRFKSALKHPFLRSYSISYWSKRRIWPVYKDLAKPRKRSQKQKSLLRERSFGATPTQKHRELKLKSLQGTKSNHCFLASDKQIGVINYRPLPCLEKCCLEEADWKHNVPSYKKCKWGKYTGRWRYWNFPNDGGDWAIPDDDYSTSEENWIILEMSRSPTRYNWYARCIDYTIQSAKEKTITRRPHRVGILPTKSRDVFHKRLAEVGARRRVVVTFLSWLFMRKKYPEMNVSELTWIVTKYELQTLPNKKVVSIQS